MQNDQPKFLTKAELCYAWNTLIDQPWKIMSVARRDWATVGYSM
jgi:hypothetical protein